MSRSRPTVRFTGPARGGAPGRTTKRMPCLTLSASEARRPGSCHRASTCETQGGFPAAGYGVPAKTSHSRADCLTRPLPRDPFADGDQQPTGNQSVRVASGIRLGEMPMRCSGVRRLMHAKASNRVP